MAQSEIVPESDFSNLFEGIQVLQDLVEEEIVAHFYVRPYM